MMRETWYGKVSLPQMRLSLLVAQPLPMATVQPMPSGWQLQRVTRLTQHLLRHQALRHLRAERQAHVPQ